MQNERKSSFEILRIISMILILMHHYSYHGNFDLSSNFNIFVYFIQSIQMFGKLGVNLFVLISGYFLSTSHFNWKKIIKLELEVIFYSFILCLLFYFFGSSQLEIKDILKSLFPLMTEEYWFYSTYLVLMLFSPFINVLIDNLDKQTYRKLIITILILWVIIPVIPKTIALEFSSLGWFTALYLFAGYIRKFPEDFNKSCSFYTLLTCGFLILLLLSVLGIDLLGLYKQSLQSSFSYFVPMNSILICFASLFMFLGFSKLEIGCIKWVNIISSATFGVYLIHDNLYVCKFLWIDFFKNNTFINSPKIFLHAPVVIFIVYAVCTIIDLFRQYCLEKPLWKLLDKKN